MEIMVNNKKVKIPMEEIQNNMKVLDISEEEAIQMWLDDNDYTINEEVEELTKKAKQNGTTKVKAGDKTKRQKTERKPTENPLKQAIIQDIYKFLQQNTTIYDIKVENPTKIITFKVENKEFKLDLVEKRQKKAEK